jgi:putative MATE family efflux protein
MTLSFFGDRQFFKLLFTLAIPIMLQFLVNSLVNMLDTVMIGQLGTVEIAAVGLGNQFFFLYTLILFGICNGGSIFTAQFWGRHDISGIRKNIGLCLTLGLSAGILFTLAALYFPQGIIGVYSRDLEVIRVGGVYLGALVPAFIPYAVSYVFSSTLISTEHVRLPMVTTIIVLSINAVLNYLFIFGAGPIPAMGVKGAAIATVIARIAEMCILTGMSYARRYAHAGPIRELLGFGLPYLGRFLRVAAPVMINEFIWALGVNTQNLIFARTHTDAIAAFNITTTVSQLTWVVFMGLGNGAGVLIGKKIGEGNETIARNYATWITRFAPLLAAGVALLLFPLSRLLPFLFKVNEGVLAITSGMFVILVCSYPFRAFNMSMVIGVCRAGGDTIFCAFFDLFFMWCVALPLAATASFIFHAPVWVIYLCIVSEEPLKMLMGSFRLRSGKWLHNVTEKG